MGRGWLSLVALDAGGMAAPACRTPAGGSQGCGLAEGCGLTKDHGQVCGHPKGSPRSTPSSCRHGAAEGLATPAPSSAVMAASFCTAPMGVALYLALVGGGLTAAFMAAVVLRGIRLI